MPKMLTIGNGDLSLVGGGVGGENDDGINFPLQDGIVPYEESDRSVYDPGVMMSGGSGGESRFFF